MRLSEGMLLARSVGARQPGRRLSSTGCSLNQEPGDRPRALGWQEGTFGADSCLCVGTRLNSRSREHFVQFQKVVQRQGHVVWGYVARLSSTSPCDAELSRVGARVACPNIELEVPERPKGCRAHLCSFASLLWRQGTAELFSVYLEHAANACLCAFSFACGLDLRLKRSACIFGGNCGSSPHIQTKTTLQEPGTELLTVTLPLRDCTSSQTKAPPSLASALFSW